MLHSFLGRRYIISKQCELLYLFIANNIATIFENMILFNVSAES